MVVDLTGTAFKVEVVFVDETATVDASGGVAGPTGIGADGFIWQAIVGLLALTKDFVIDGIDVTGSIESGFLLEFEAVVTEGEDFFEGVVVTDLVGTGLFEPVLLAAVTGLILSL